MTNSFAGISFASGAADSELQGLAMRAQAGDKHAQLELGIRYEQGRGVPVNLARAEHLYRLAASDSSGSGLVYLPPVGTARGQVVPVRTGQSSRGLDEARERLDRIIARRRVSQ
ncbi:SEL1-like repeat protein [Sphingosinicella terrae]|uniref:SEL1-like repeat protein n=1 Tax=Sphingosinicella terrae TaxID=2172047 RepID=UPI0013B3D9F5|nr:SEL1-like repeat protein [Sphingosinicella terrae]